ncbi:unnamed protein product [Blepharisma stoltei]|uniref:Uncharacterized protein n=1 Tax=Blepharisma stoltei TaxID=1481888 RepID=A0AAU9IDT9_9CILI|nr:unnamed protein product [Blepharisma stoltei]
MLWNDKCDEACNNFDCQYDYYVCGCSNDCKAEDYGNCKPECLIADCKWDQISINPEKKCKNRDLFLYTLFHQVIITELNHSVDFENCFLDSNNTCTLEMSLSNSECYPGCYIENCNWGLCNVTETTCSLPSWNYCRYCIFNKSCSYYSDNNYQMKADIFGIQIGYTNSYKDSDFYIYHVISTQKDTSPSGDGSFDSPFETLEYALQSIGNLSSKIIFLILANDGIITYLIRIYLYLLEA